MVALALGVWLVAGQDVVWAVKQLLMLGAGPAVVSAQAPTWGSITGTLSSQTDLNTALNGKLAANGNGSALTGLVKSQVGLANADNTSDVNKPVSTATQTALDLKLATNGNGGSLTGLTRAQVGLANVDNTADLNKSVASAATLTTPRTINGTSFNGSSNVTVTAAGSTLTDNVPFARGGIGACAATSATTGVQTVNMTAPCITITPTGATTLNASGGVAGQIATFSITTSGTSSFVITFGTNFRKTGTLATGTVSARFFTVTFRCLDGTIWTEMGRTAVQT